MTTRGRTVGRAEFDALKGKHHRWGRWCPDDELGAPNVISAEMITSAARLVRRGTGLQFTDDMIVMPLQTATH